MESTLKIELNYDQLADKMSERGIGKITGSTNGIKHERVKIRGIRGLAAYIGCSPSKAQDIKNKNEVPYYTYGNRVFFYAHEIDAALKRDKE